jgi:CubicO group peptidase (beta-lactamase class C family)
MRFGGLAAVAVAALIVASPTLAQSAQQQMTSAAANDAKFYAKLSDADVAKRVQAVIDRYEARPEFVGLSVAVARGDHLIVDEGVGIADLEWKAPADAGTAMRIGSLTKQFTAAAIMKLHEQGKIGLDDSISKYLPDFDTEGHTVTIRQLLTHSSGIPDYGRQMNFITKEAPLDLSDKELLATIKGVPFDFEPGTKWEYSNTNFYLLGMIVAKMSGMSYADYMQRAFFDPLGLTHTRYGATAPIIPERAQGYSYDFATKTHLNAAPLSMNVPGGAGALISTAGDLLRWQIALTGGRAVSPASYREMIDSAVQTGQGDSRYGFGLGIGKLDGHQVISHNGGINGFNSVLSYVPDVGLRVAVISNSEVMFSEMIGNDIFAVLTSDKPLPPLRSTPQPGGGAFLRKLIADEAAGTIDYSTMLPPMADAVRAHPAQAMFKAWGAITRVTYVMTSLAGIDVYRVDFDSGASQIFNITLTPDGKLAFMIFAPANPPAMP